MAYPTPAEIDAAVPMDGTPSRALTNAVIKGIVGTASFIPEDGTVALRSVENENFTGGRMKANMGTDPDDCVNLVQLQNFQFAPMNWGPFPIADLDPLSMWVPGAVVNANSTSAQQGYFSMSDQPLQKSLALRDTNGRLKAVAGVAADDVVVMSQINATRQSVTGPIVAAGDKLFVTVGGVEVGIEYLSATSLRQYMKATGANVVVDYRCMSIWGASAVDAATFDGVTVTTTPTITDIETYDDSNETIINHLRVGDQVWEIGAFLSGNGARCAVWADRKA